MRFETPSIPKKEEHYSLDDPWYERFKNIGNFQDYELLEGDKESRNKQKEAFLNDEIKNPDLGYPKLENFALEKRERLLLELKKTIENNETNEILKKAYLWRLNEKIAETRMLKAAKDGDDRRFSRYSKFIYGEPSKDVYEYTLSQLKKIIDQKLSDDNPDIRQAAERLNRALFDDLMNNDNNINPDDFDLLKIKSTKEDRQYDAEEIKQAFEAALGKFQVEGWQITVDDKSSSSGISTSQERKMVIIPQTRKIKETYLSSLIRHEIETHVLRRESGEKSKLKLLGLGLDRNLPGEEGIATFREQEVEGTRNFSGFEGHLAISLASGLDGEKRDFRRVFEIMRDYYFINSSKKDTEEAWKAAQDSAWNRCVRTFRGTTCGTAGACLTRDITYREGNIGVWNVIKNNSDEQRRFSVGKYDPSNPRHIWILEQLNIENAELDGEIEK